MCYQEAQAPPLWELEIGACGLPITGISIGKLGWAEQRGDEIREKNFRSPHSDWLISDRTFRRGTKYRNDIHRSLRHANLRVQYATALQRLAVRWACSEGSSRRCRVSTATYDIPGQSAMIAGFQAPRRTPASHSPQRLPPPPPRDRGAEGEIRVSPSVFRQQGLRW